MAQASPLADLHDHMLDQVNRAIDILTFGTGERPESAPRVAGKPRFRVIVACTDGSREAEPALSWASELAKIHGARVVVASVFSPPHLDGGAAASLAFYSGYIADHTAAERRLREVAESAADRLREDGVPVDVVVSHGSPAHELVEIAKAHHADLVVLGTHDRGALGRALAGSTPEAILDRVPASVLIARGPPRPGHVLVATDGSHAASRAVAYGIRHAEAMGADVVIQHVLEYPEQAERVPAPGLLRDVVARMALDAPPRIRYHLDAGRPAARILAKAEEMGAGLIVVGSRGRGRVKAWLLGSVSRAVVSNASTSVLVVKSPAR